MAPIRRSKIPIEVRRAVAFDSFGRCQYRGCTKELISNDQNSGEPTITGVFAHILPIGDNGPRSEYKRSFDIDINSPVNLILLCPDHHLLVDQTEIDKHPPHILFRMKTEKSIFIRETITEHLETQNLLQTGAEDYEREYRMCAVMDLFSRARRLGPRKGNKKFKEAEQKLNIMRKDPFFKNRKEAKLLCATEYNYTKLFLFYDIKHWQAALRHTIRAIKLDLPNYLSSHLLSCSIILVRDEYGVFSKEEKLSLIVQLIELTDKGMKSHTETAALLLLVKSALLRWRGRFLVGPNQRSSYSEAERCCARSHELSQNPGCLLQSALINYSRALSFHVEDWPKHRQYIDRCVEILDSPELSSFPAAMKYKPRILREIYRFTDSMRAFWICSDEYHNESLRTAYVLGEAAIGEYLHGERGDSGGIVDARSFLEEAIDEGYAHGRNVTAYIGCRGILDPEWFRRTILRGVFDENDSDIAWETVLGRITTDPLCQTTQLEGPGFGVDEGEFWNTAGMVAGHVLRDHATAIRLLHIAERHAAVTSGRFRAFVELARQYKDVGSFENYIHYLGLARSVARAHQHTVIAELEAS